MRFLFIFLGLIFLQPIMGFADEQSNALFEYKHYDIFHFDETCCEGLDEKFITMLEPSIIDQDIEVGYVLVDLNHDLKTDLLVQFQNSMECGSGGCSSYFLLNEGGGHYKVIGGNHLYDSVSHKKEDGFRDIIMPTDDNRFCTFSWDGESYQFKSCEDVN